ncbi:MAG TPA: hypothetical protein VMT46_07850 [Anaerolineaceae bacterium]|nr:hypothetical protein [Anaerolineaceae bacterium]
MKQTEAGEGNLADAWIVPWIAVGLLLAARLWTVMALPLDGLRGYGDFIHFFRMADLPGWPYLQSWSEFPPMFPFLAEILYRLAHGQEHVFVYLLFLTLMAADAGSLYLFTRLAMSMENRRDQLIATAAFTVVLSSLPYQWWYFDSLAVFFMLFSLYWWQQNKAIPAGLALAAGILTKYFPVLLLAAMYRQGRGKRFLLTACTGLGLTLLVNGILWISAPEMTAASLASQSQKGSWETVWALADGNLSTGNFGPEIERLDPAKAYIPRGKPAAFSPLASLALFGSVGLGALLSVKVKNFQEMTWMTGLAFCLLFLWSPGWSPQWVFYLIPLLLLGSRPREGILMAFVLIFLNLLEWPVLLSRGLFWGLWLTIPLRTLLILVLGLSWYQKLRGALQHKEALGPAVQP